MTNPRPLMMIPGPIELSPRVQEALAAHPPSHTSGALIESFGRCLEMTRVIMCASDDAQPFIITGSGTLAMEVAACNVMAPGERALVVSTGYFSARMSEVLRRRGVEVVEVGAAPGGQPSIETLEAAIQAQGPFKALFATHVDTSTGVRVQPQALAALARQHDMLSVFDGVCATAAERFEMAAWDADVYLTGSQKALGAPPGLALMTASPRALAARAALSGAPPLYLDWDAWRPIMRAYQERRPSYFATPATGLILALEAAMEEVLSDGLEARLNLYGRAVCGLHAAWGALGLSLVPAVPEASALTLSALYYPEGVDASLLAAAATRGVIFAGGLHPDFKARYFRVGHMGYTITQPAMLSRAVEALDGALRDVGYTPPGDAVAALNAHLTR
jgi:alanine-glyoxylate transaminase/serine-glyoxylate transaminase/serine-pyruvate transaminase